MALDKWAKVHAHRRAVARGKANPILCPDCALEMGVFVGSDEEPIFRCFSCRVVFEPGLDVWDQIDAVLKDIPTHIDDYFGKKNDN